MYTQQADAHLNMNEELHLVYCTSSNARHALQLGTARTQMQTKVDK